MIEAIAGVGAGLIAIHTVGAHAVARRAALSRRRDMHDSVALTFDDGPHPDATPRILECLAEHNVPATFFMVGRQVEAHPEVARDVVAGGHEAANHGTSHRHLWTCGPGATRSEIQRGHSAIEDITGQAPRAFRPPWGIFNVWAPAAARRLGETPVTWSVRSEGLVWRPSAEEMAEHIASRTQGGDIINLHDAGGFPDTPQRVLTALPAVIARLRDAGFRFVPISVML